MIQDRQLSGLSHVAVEKRWLPGENSLQLVGLILCLEDLSELALLKKVQMLFTGKGVACRTCVYQKNDKILIPTELVDHDIVLLNQKSVNWYGLVRSGCADAFLQESFDLIVNLSKKYFFTTAYMASMAKATLKIGRYVRPQSPYRIVLGAKPSDDEDAFVHLLDNSLKFIRLR